MLVTACNTGHHYPVLGSLRGWFVNFIDLYVMKEDMSRSQNSGSEDYYNITTVIPVIISEVVHNGSLYLSLTEVLHRTTRTPN